jgi:penicillin-binding protein 1B
VPKDGIELAYVNSESGNRTDAVCTGARELPFAAGYAPEEVDHCPVDELKNFFRGGPSDPAKSADDP